jgi:hypothetical protein
MSNETPSDSSMPLPVALRLLAQQIKEGDGLRDNRMLHHRMLERAADALTPGVAPSVPAEVGEAAADNTHAWERIAMLLAEQDGQDPHQLIWEGNPPEPYGEVWCKYEFKARQIAELFATPSPEAREPAPEQGEVGVKCRHDSQRCSTYVECAANGCKHAEQKPEAASSDAITEAWDKVREEARSVSGGRFGLGNLLSAVDAYATLVAAAAPAEPKAQAQAAEPVPWLPYLSDRADGVRGHYAIARWNPAGYREVWNLRRHHWGAFSDEVLTFDQALVLLQSLVIPTADKGAL